MSQKYATNWKHQGQTSAEIKLFGKCHNRWQKNVIQNNCRQNEKILRKMGTKRKLVLRIWKTVEIFKKHNNERELGKFGPHRALRDREKYQKTNLTGLWKCMVEQTLGRIIKRYTLLRVTKDSCGEPRSPKFMEFGHEKNITSNHQNHCYPSCC